MTQEMALNCLFIQVFDLSQRKLTISLIKCAAKIPNNTVLQLALSFHNHKNNCTANCLTARRNRLAAMWS
jgi:hypothetical protein